MKIGPSEEENWFYIQVKYQSITWKLNKSVYIAIYAVLIMS